MSSTTPGRVIDNPLIDGDTFINRGGGTMTAITIENRSANNIVDPCVKGCHFVDVNTAINIINTIPGGTVRLYNLTHAGAAPAINNGPATPETQGNSF